MNVRKAEKNLNRMALPDITEPFSVHTYWFQYHHEPPREKAVLHHHTFFEVHFVRSGIARYRYRDGATVTIRAGEWILIPPELPHVAEGTEGDFRKFSLGFSFQDTRENALSAFVAEKLRSDVCIHGKDSDACAPLFEDALRSAELPTALSPYRIRNVVFALVEEILRFSGVSTEERAALAPSSEDIRIARAKRFITDNARRSFTAADVAATVHLSEKQLSRVFLAAEGESIVSFIRRARLNEAKALLRSSDAPLKEISEALGHSSEYNFIRFFKSAEGMTPGAFRRITQK